LGTRVYLDLKMWCVNTCRAKETEGRWKTEIGRNTSQLFQNTSARKIWTQVLRRKEGQNIWSQVFAPPRIFCTTTKIWKETLYRKKGGSPCFFFHTQKNPIFSTSTSPSLNASHLTNWMPTSSKSTTPRPCTVTKLLNGASETSATDPMANPFPMAAVVLPVESKASVMSRTPSPRPAISTIPLIQRESIIGKSTRIPLQVCQRL